MIYQPSVGEGEAGCILNTSPLRREPKAGSDLSSGLVDLNSPGNPWHSTCPLSIHLHLGWWMPPVLECLWGGGFPLLQRRVHRGDPRFLGRGTRRVKTLPSSLLQTEKQKTTSGGSSQMHRVAAALKAAGAVTKQYRSGLLNFARDSGTSESDSAPRLVFLFTDPGSRSPRPTQCSSALATPAAGQARCLPARPWLSCF